VIQMGKTKREILVLLCIFLSVFSMIIVELKLNYVDDEECVCVIVAGRAAKNGRVILMKNRDTSDTQNKPVYYASDGDGTYAYVMVNGYWMGINERGLAVANTAVGALRFGGSGMDNGALNAWIIKHCETVEEVCSKLNDTESPIGPGKRLGGTCIGIIDRFGVGAFIEISGVGAYARFIVDGYDSQANHPRYYPGYASGPSGRDAYALEILDEIYSKKGFISWEDVAQDVSRYVHHKELGDSCFSISGEMCRDITQAAIVAVSGDPRYEGKLNCMWGEYGNPPMVGLFVPSMAYAGEPPSVLDDFWNEVWKKRSYAKGSCGSYYDPVKVREIQSYTFFAEYYSFGKYDELVATIPNDLSDTELKTYLQNFVNDAVQVATRIYVGEPEVLKHSVFKFNVTTVSNFTVSDFEFTYCPTLEITFTVSGSPGTHGFCYVTIPTKLWSGGFIVFVGENQYKITEPFRYRGESWLNFTLNNSSYVKIVKMSSPHGGGFGGGRRLLCSHAFQLFSSLVTHCNSW